MDLLNSSCSKTTIWSEWNKIKGEKMATTRIKGLRFVRILHLNQTTEEKQISIKSVKYMNRYKSKDIIKIHMKCHYHAIRECKSKPQ